MAPNVSFETHLIALTHSKTLLRLAMSDCLRAILLPLPPKTSQTSLFASVDPLLWLSRKEGGGRVRNNGAASPLTSASQHMEFHSCPFMIGSVVADLLRGGGAASVCLFILLPQRTRRKCPSKQRESFDGYALLVGETGVRPDDQFHFSLWSHCFGVRCSS